MSRNKIILWGTIGIIFVFSIYVIYIKSGSKYTYPVSNPKKLNVISLDKNDSRLNDFKVCPKEQIAKVEGVDTIFTYSKKLSNDSEWTYFKELEAGNFHMYFYLPIDSLEYVEIRKFCYYDVGVFKDSMHLKNVPLGMKNSILFLKYDEKNKQYFVTYLNAGKDNCGRISKSPFHELRVYPQEMPKRNDGSHYEGSFFIKGLEKKPQ